MADPALAVRLLGLDADALLAGREVGPPIPRGGTLLGHLSEALVTLSVRVFAQAAEAEVRHPRQQGGSREVDLIVVRTDQKVLAAEVKLSATIRDEDVRNLRWLGERIGDEMLDAIVVHTGPAAYRREDGIAVVPAALLGPRGTTSGAISAPGSPPSPPASRRTHFHVRGRETAPDTHAANPHVVGRPPRQRIGLFTLTIYIPSQPCRPQNQPFIKLLLIGAP